MTDRTVRLISGGLAVAGSILALGNNITALPIPGGLSQYWPMVYGIAFAFDRFAHAYLNPPQPQTPKTP